MIQVGDFVEVISGFSHYYKFGDIVKVDCILDREVIRCVDRSGFVQWLKFIDVLLIPDYEDKF